MLTITALEFSPRGTGQIWDRPGGDMRVIADRLASDLEPRVREQIVSLAGLTLGERLDAAAPAALAIAYIGDLLQFTEGEKIPADPNIAALRTPISRSDAMNLLARGIAVAAHQPGGIDFAARHWCSDHDQCAAPAESP